MQVARVWAFGAILHFEGFSQNIRFLDATWLVISQLL
jgi:hypothetical protein